MPPKPEQDSVTSGSSTIEYTVVRSARRKRTITLRVLRGAVEVLAPKRTPKRDIREFVEAKSAWVLDKLANPPVRAQVTPFGHGDTVPYLGYTRPVVVQSGTTKTVEVSLHDHFCAETDDAPDNLVLHHFHVTVPEGIDDEARPQRVRTALARWYSARAEKWFSEEVAEWLPLVAPKAKPEVRISNARSQWGSCSRNGVLRFSWRCMMLQPYEIEYIVVHELAHLLVGNHSKAFWRVVTKAMPDAIEHRRGITRKAKTLPR